MSKSDREPIDAKKSEQTIEIAEYLSTHPANETRSNYLEQLMPKVYEYYDHYWNKLINWNIMKKKWKALLLRKQCNCKELD